MLMNSNAKKNMESVPDFSEVRKEKSEGKIGKGNAFVSMGENVDEGTGRWCTRSVGNAFSTS